jgi:quercetin 2,3-dioxygenase
MSQMTAKPSAASRSVSRIVEGKQVAEGDGMIVRRAFPTAKLEDLDPFLLLDEMGPIEFAAGQAGGFPDHPHRGFETVTYLLEGAMEHRDSRGNHGVLKPGDVQWMTAGSGIVHSEMPETTLRRNGGRLHGFQLWVNLPRAAKMVEPRYQEIPAARIPTGETPGKDVEVKVIAGEALGRHAVIETRTPILYLHYKLGPGASVTQGVARQDNVFAYVIEGQAQVGRDSAPLPAGHVAVFAKDGDSVRLANDAGAKAPASVLLIGGEPLGEPVARYGPFVMNTKAELSQAFEDFRSGRMGMIERR